MSKKQKQKAARGEQKVFDGHEPPSIGKLDRLVRACHKLGTARSAAQTDENKKRQLLEIEMEANANAITNGDGDLVYRVGNVVARMKGNRKLSVKTEKPVEQPASDFEDEGGLDVFEAEENA